MNSAYKYIQDDENLLNGLTPGTSQQLPPVNTPLQMPPTAPVNAPPPIVPQNVPHGAMDNGGSQVKLPGMPSNIGVSDIEPYLNTQRAQLNKFGPQQQTDLANALQNRRESFGYKATDALKGFSDALMQGVAGAGNPGNQAQFQGQENLQDQQAMQNLKDAQASGLSNQQANMSLDQMNPNSQLSKISQQTYAPLFEKLGYPPSTLKGMSAAKIENAIQLMTAYGGKEKESLIQMFQAQLNATENKRHNVEMENLGKEKNQSESLSELAKMPWYSRILHPDISGELKQQSGIDKPEGTPFLKTATNKKTGERMGTRDGKTWEPLP